MSSQSAWWAQSAKTESWHPSLETRQILAAKAEFARIGRYYATESMLVLDPTTGRYDAAATSSTGSDTLFDFYARAIAGEVTTERGNHSVS